MSAHMFITPLNFLYNLTIEELEKYIAVQKTFRKFNKDNRFELDRAMGAYDNLANALPELEVKKLLGFKSSDDVSAFLQREGLKNTPVMRLALLQAEKFGKANLIYQDYRLRNATTEEIE